MTEVLATTRSLPPLQARMSALSRSESRDKSATRCRAGLPGIFGARWPRSTSPSSAASFSYERCHFILEGPTLAIGEQAVNHLALVFHELATNASKHGALHAEDGSVAVKWAMDGDQVHLIWTEHGATAVQASEHTGSARWCPRRSRGSAEKSRMTDGRAG